MKNRYYRQRKNSGQMLIIGALLGIIVFVFGYMLLNIGRVTDERVRLQNVADTAAFAAAETQANTVSAMGWINQAMGTVYYYMASHAANVTVESTKMSFLHHAYNGNMNNTFPQMDGNAALQKQRNTIRFDTGLEFSDGRVLNETDIISSYEKAYQDAYTMIPRGEIWLWEMAKVQRGMAYIAPLMAEKEVYLAIKDKAARAAIFPKFKMYVDPANNFDLEIHKIYEVGMKTGWDMAGNPGGLALFAERDESDAVAKYADDPLTDDPDIWKVTLRYKLDPSEPENQLIIKSVGKVPPANEVSEYHIEGTFPGWEAPGKTVLYDPSGTTMILGNGDTVTITQNPDGSTTVAGGSTNITYRRNGNALEVADGAGGWTSTGEVSTNIDGADVRVTTNFSVSLGGVTIIDPNHYVIGNTHIDVYKDNIDISTQIGRARVETEAGGVIVNGLHTNTADGKWRRRDSAWTQTLHDQGGDTIRHRMLVINADTDWKYELREIGSYTQEESDVAIQGDGRYSIRNGGSFVLDRQGLDKDQIPWLGYPSEQAKELEDDKFTTKWYDLANINGGKPLEFKEVINGEEVTIESYYQCAKCWNPECVANESKGFYPVHYRLFTNDGTKTPIKVGGVHVDFIELEMCRICYDNHRVFNDKKRKVSFGTPEYPAISAITNNGRVVVWSNYDDGKFGGSVNTYNNASYLWERTASTTEFIVGTDFSKRPAHRGAVENNAAFIPQYLLDHIGDQTGVSITLLELQGLAKNVTLLWDMDHDGDNIADVIMYPTDARELSRNVATWYYLNDASGVTVNDSLKSMQLLSLSCPKPMVLSEDFFKYGINVAVTSDKYTETDQKRFLGLANQDKGGHSSFFSAIGPTTWGMVAVSSARCAFWLESNGEGSYIFTPGDIDWSKDREYAAAYQSFKNNTLLGKDGSMEFAYDDTVNFEPQSEYRMRRQFFVRRHRANLYTSDWVAKLVPLKFAIRKEDLDLSETDDFDSSARYIYYNLMRTEWRESYIKTSGWKPPESMTLGPKGPALSTSHTDTEALFTH